MSLLPSGTFASPNESYYGAGGGGGSLTSPVNIAGNPDATINLSAPAGPSQLQFINGANSWQILTATGGPNNIIIQPTSGTFNNSPMLSIDADLSGTVFLGTSLNGTLVQSRNTLLVTDFLGGGDAGNGIVISPQSATVNKISGVVASGGSLRLGSSVATPSVVNISDTGANTGTFQVGGNGGDPLLIAGGQIAPNNYSVIRPNTGSAGELYIGSSTSTNPNAIHLTDTATQISKLGGAPVTLLAAQTIAPTASVAVPLPVNEGLYSIVGCGVGLLATAQTRQAQFSCMAYINAAGAVQMGGNATCDVGALGGTDSVTFQVTPTANGFIIYNGGPQSLVSFQISAFRISGPIPGVV